MDTEHFLLRRQEIEARMQTRRSEPVQGWSRLALNILSNPGWLQLLPGVILPVAGSLVMKRFGSRGRRAGSDGILSDLLSPGKKPFLSRIVDFVSRLKS